MALSSSNISDLKSQWEGELGQPICEESWETALGRVHSSWICARHGLLQFKILHCVHWTKLRLSKRFSAVDPLCDRCKCNPASHTHMFWSCTKIAHYWTSIFDTMSGFLGQPISPCPLVVLSGVLPDHSGLTRAQSFIFIIIFSLLLFLFCLCLSVRLFYCTLHCSFLSFVFYCMSVTTFVKNVSDMFKM